MSISDVNIRHRRNFYSKRRSKRKQVLPDWIITGGGPEVDIGRGVTLDKKLNVYTVGTFQNRAELGQFPLLTSADTETFVAKLSCLGRIIWVAQPRTLEGRTEGRSIAVDSCGNTYITGFFTGIVLFGSTKLDSGGAINTFIAKLDCKGRFEWVIPGISEDANEGFSIVTDEEDQIHAVGFFTNKVRFGNFFLSDDDETVYAVQINPRGEVRRAVQTDSGESRAMGVTRTERGIYLTGVFRNTVRFGPNTLVSAGNDDIFIARLNDDFQFDRAVRAGGPDDDQGNAITRDDDGRIYITGFFEGEANFGSIRVVSRAEADIYIARYSSDLNAEWVVQAGNTDVNEGRSISVRNGTVGVAANFVEPIIIGGRRFTTDPGAESGQLEWYVRTDNGNTIDVRNGRNGSAESMATASTDIGDIVVTIGFYVGNTRIDDDFVRGRGMEDIYIRAERFPSACIN